MGALMLGEYIHYGLLVALAIALLVAAFTDLRRRQIDNWLTAGVALAAVAAVAVAGFVAVVGAAVVTAGRRRQSHECDDQASTR